jgi:hypothetical protein
LTTPGISTFIKPIAKQATIWPTYSTCHAGTTRNAVPIVSSINKASNARSLPRRRTSIGASGPNRPKHNDGNVVSTLAPVRDRFVARTASSSIGPTLVIGVRSEKAISARLAASAMLRARESCGAASATGRAVPRRSVDAVAASAAARWE